VLSTLLGIVEWLTDKLLQRRRNKIADQHWLADKLLQRSRDKIADQRNAAADLKEKRERVAKYFEEIASTLEEMLSKFREREVPRIAGNKLDVLLADFNRVVHSNL
jgi:hypothetical protein